MRSPMENRSSGDPRSTLEQLLDALKVTDALAARGVDELKALLRVLDGARRGPRGDHQEA